ncbi:MAG TPA: RNA polymerase sigma factor [Anaeromyxobacteraceae bacterium]|nr:RNA polymerase sigma factor [Anaeromyxobacteraceae bacterium]
MTPDEVARLYERFGYAVLRRCRRLVRDDAAAEDLLHDVFVRVLRYGDGFQGTSALAWLHRIADRACLDRLERERPRARLRGNGAPEPASGDGPLPRSEASLLLAELLGQLPRSLRQVAILYYVDDMDQLEIAAALDCSTMTVRRRLRALHQAAAALTETPAQEGDHASSRS